MIVVQGSINLDLVAQVHRLPRPGETLHGIAFDTYPGGKGANQALAARRAGAEVALFGAVGRDAFAPAALALLRAGGVDLEGVRAVDSATGVALIHVDGAGENSITIIPGANAHVAADDIPDRLLGTSTVIVMQLEIPPSNAAMLAQRARAAGALVVLNAAPALTLTPDQLANVDVLVVNEHEAATLAPLFRLPGEPEGFAVAAAERFGNAVVVTLGARGLVAVSGADRFCIAAPRVSVVDSTGAGDALVGTLAAALDRGTPWPQALKEGAAAGSLACARPGAQASLPHRDAILALAATI